ncbi:MAG: pyridoxamine 5'-phosphate oxidase family protein [Gammaproteobacteria bacterium]|nr:pyridoxamine 5'-phosphate oxidase family protein [Gammaproteobacteria bacterium]
MNNLSSEVTEPSLMLPKLTTEQALAEFHAFNQQFNSVILATVNAEGFADASYAPTLQLNGCFYIYISALAAHTQNILHKPAASLLFIEPETPANLFRRQRSMIRCCAKPIARETQAWAQLIDRFEQLLGKMMRTLRELTDFQLIELTPKQATYVRGFAQTYHFSEEDLSADFTAKDDIQAQICEKH